MKTLSTQFHRQARRIFYYILLLAALIYGTFTLAFYSVHHLRVEIANNVLTKEAMQCVQACYAKVGPAELLKRAEGVEKSGEGSRATVRVRITLVAATIISIALTYLFACFIVRHLRRAEPTF